MECLFFGEPSGLSCYSVHRQHRPRLQEGRGFFTPGFPANPTSKIFSLQSPKKPPPSHGSCTRKREEATRQQGSLFFRENSSNGGKAIRTFWRNTKFGKIPCQG